MIKESKTTWSIGATSKIAIELARIWARGGESFVLASRKKSELLDIASDLKIRGAKEVEIFSLEELATELGWNSSSKGSKESKEPKESRGKVNRPMDRLLISLGSLSDQGNWQENRDYRFNEWETNSTKVFDWVEWGANQIEKTGHGQICVMTSVAADRAKKSNYAYGAAKAALDFYLEGVSHRLEKIGKTSDLKSRVSVLKPGPTKTPMTADLMGTKKLANPQTVAIDFAKAIKKGKPIIYSPWIWKFIMLIIKYIPRKVWFKTDF